MSTQYVYLLNPFYNSRSQGMLLDQIVSYLEKSLRCTTGYSLLYTYIKKELTPVAKAN